MATVRASELAIDQIIIEDLCLNASIGVFEEEKKNRQPVRINLILDLVSIGRGENHALGNVVRYDLICDSIAAHLHSGHIDLVETLAEDIASICLKYDRCFRADVHVVKPNAIDTAKSVGVRLVRKSL